MREPATPRWEVLRAWSQRWEVGHTIWRSLNALEWPLKGFRVPPKMLIATVVFLYITGVRGDQCDYFRFCNHALLSMPLPTSNCQKTVEKL